MRKLLVVALFAGSAFAQSYNGNLDVISCPQIDGWAWQAPYQTSYVDVYDGATLVMSNQAAGTYRADLQAAGYDNGNHAFFINASASLLDGRLHQIYVKFAGTQVNVGNTPLPMQCTVKSQGYQYYYQSTFGDPGSWNSNGSVSASGGLFSSSSEGSWISNVAVPDGSFNYEVRTVLSLKQSGGTYVEYLDATGNAISGQGTAIQVTLSDPEFSGGGCTASLSVNDMVNGSSTQDAQWTIPCADGMEMRAVAGPYGAGTTWVGLIVGGTFYWTVSSITSGQPGVGAISTPSGNGLTLAYLGPLDREAPGTVNSGSVSTYLTPNEVDLSWAGVADNPSDGNGVGVMYYVIARDGNLIGISTSDDYTDTDVSPGQSHTYQIYAQDWHNNWSGAATVSITVPAAGSVDPRRVGVLPTGNYWGGMGEQVDVLSGNVNFSISLLKATGRQGWTVPIGLSYNSQNWREEGSTSWVMGADVGYGFGWQLMAGSIRPYWNGWSLDHFVFTDATGAQYRLDQQNGNVWSSKQSIYVWYDYSTSYLHFKDGSYWYMGCISSGEEPDAGAMYPTLMEDSNGNQITITYLPGAGPYASNGAGTNPPDSSARISQILDARPGAYNFTYNSDAINHLTGITNTYGTAENYSFTVSNNIGLYSPFSGSSACGSTNTNCGYVGLLSSVTRSGVNLTTSFGYDSNGYGDLTQVTFPYGGHIRWAYRNFTYAGGRTMREAATRYLLKDPTASETTYNLYRDDAGDASRVVHAWFVVQDPSGSAGKAWNFNFNSAVNPLWQIGLAWEQDNRNSFGSYPGQHLSNFTWSQDAGGNPYISQTDTYLDQGTANQRHSYTTTTLDSHGYGNVVQSQVYDYAANGSSPALLRTTTNTYLIDGSINGVFRNNAQYDAAYIRNRVASTTVTPASGSGTTVTSYVYDNYPSWYPYYGLNADAPGVLRHDGAMGTNNGLRGNATQTTTTAGTTSNNYDIEGNSVQSQDALGNLTTVTVDGFGNVPQTATPNGNGNLSTSFSFNSFLAPTSVSQPSNGTSATMTYDLYGRPQTSTSPDGAVTHYYYCPDSCSPGVSLPATRNGQNYSTITVVNTRWSRDQYDGLGRVIRTDRGDTSGNVISNVDTNYDSCACSPTGKMVAKSQPYAPGAAVYWTSYTYDGLGRTLQVTAADGSSHTNYAYYGSTTVVTDPAGNWKAMTTDVDGNLKSVIEPDPAYSPSVLSSAQTIDCVSTQAPSGMLGTCYTYDSLKNLIGVTMPRSTGTQTRSFTYKAGTSWLMTATNPENGTVTYTRDANGNVTSRVDAKGQTTNYTYDGYNRVTQVARNNDPCQTEYYYYDQGIDGSFPSGASWGKLTAVLFGYGTAGTGVCPGSGSNSSTWSGMTYEYQYASTGRTTGKRMHVQRSLYGTQQYNLDAYWTYDNEGRVLSLQYPVVTDPNSGNPTSTSLAYTYDNMGRPMAMTDGATYDYAVNGLQYNASDQMTAISYGLNGNGGNGGGTIVESRAYNAMNQVTSLSVMGYSFGWQSFSEQYNYASGQNNGQIASVTEGTGETVAYQYDRLKRLIAANSTFGWSQQYGYDGFGNMTYKSGSFSAMADPATNRLVGIGSYDANGNLYLGNWSYDAENRLVSTDGSNSDAERYMYDGSNKRVYKQPGGALETYWFYGLDGKVMGEYTVDWNNGPLALDLVTESAYFGGKKVMPALARDRVGSVRTFSGPANHPYGENYSGNNSDGFATYYQDSSTGLNYADQRYYNATYGRFNTPDRYIALTGGANNPADPQSWNRYSYVGNDPANWGDPSGQFRAADDGGDGGSDPCVSDPTMLGCLPASGGPGPYQTGYRAHLNQFQKAAGYLNTAQEVLSDRDTFSSDCLNDLQAIGATRSPDIRSELSINSLIEAVAGAQIQNGVGSTALVSSLYPGNAGQSFGTATIGSRFAANPLGLTALSQLGSNQQVGTTIYVNPGLITNNVKNNEGLLLHEGLHLLGFDDADLQKGLGLPIDPNNTKSTTTKLTTDCVTGKGNQ